MSSVSSFAASARESLLSFKEEMQESSQRYKNTFGEEAFKKSYENPEDRKEHRKAFSQAVSEVTAVVGLGLVMAPMGQYVAQNGVVESMTSAIEALNTLPVSPVASVSALIAMGAATVYGSYKGAGKVFDKLLEREEDRSTRELLDPKTLAKELQEIKAFDRVSEQMINNFDNFLQSEENRESRKKAYSANFSNVRSGPSA